MRIGKKDITLFVRTHVNIVENYGFMTFMQLFSVLIGLFLYPYLIRTIGSNHYGIYAFAFSVYTYFNVIQTFGFHTPVVKELTLHAADTAHRDRTVSLVYSAKLYLLAIATLLLCLLLLFVPLLHRHWVVISICYAQIIGEAIFPTWYFQAMQKMWVVTMVRVIPRLVSIPFILLLINQPDDYILYTIIASTTTLLSGAFATGYLLIRERVRLRLHAPKATKQLFADSFPFFWNNLVVTIKEESITIMLGTFFSMKDVALYDLAKKITLIPQLLLINLNKAIFPDVITRLSEPLRKRIMRFETVVAAMIVGGIIVFGKIVVLVLGGKEMSGAYLPAVLFSFTLMSWVISESYIHYVFLPHNRYNYIWHNQMISLVVFVGYVVACLMFFPHIAALVAALTVGGVAEVVYCFCMARQLTRNTTP